MTKTFESFQQEWFENVAKGMQATTSSQTVVVTAAPALDMYKRNQALSDELDALHKETDDCRETTARAIAAQEKMRKERDFHRLQHRRVLQEKTELMQELKRLHQQCKATEPQVEQLEQKYETLMRQNMLTTIDRDRARNQVQTLKATWRTQDLNTPTPATATGGLGATAITAPSTTATMRQTLRKENTMLIDAAPDFSQTQPLSNYKAMTSSRVRTLAPGPAIAAHTQAVSALAAHPTRNVVATGSDDTDIGVWECPSGKNIAMLRGHRGFVSSVDYSTNGEFLLSGSGDSTVKLWDVSKQECVATMTEHSHPVWCVAMHYSGAFGASASMDTNVKVWDLSTQKSKLTLRGHRDAVNTVAFQYLSNTVASGSADRTVVLWDARSGLQTRTLRGHSSPINSLAFSRAGDRLSSVDADGNVVYWDMRTLAPVWVSETMSGLAAQRVCVEPGGDVIAVAAEDGSVRIFETSDGSDAAQLSGHADAVLGAVFASSGDYIASSGADSVLRFWI